MTLTSTLTCTYAFGALMSTCSSCADQTTGPHHTEMNILSCAAGVLCQTIGTNNTDMNTLFCAAGVMVKQ